MTRRLGVTVFLTLTDAAPSDAEVAGAVHDLLEFVLPTVNGLPLVATVVNGWVASVDDYDFGVPM